MTRPSSLKLIEAYYAAFNKGDMEAFFALLTEDIVHDINQGKRETGKDAFRTFMQRMNLCYKEEIADLVVMLNDDGDRAAVEFTVLGEYLRSDDGLPPAHGQIYRLPAGAFFEIRDGKIARISNFYNLQDWVAQVSG